MFNSKVFVAELIGTFVLVFVAAYTGIYSNGQDLMMIALGSGLTLAVFVYVFGNTSGAHVNPAVTFGFALQGVVDWGKAVVSYWVPQFLGAIGAAFMVKTFLDPLNPDLFRGMATVATTGALNDVHPYHAMGLEVLLTFFLVNTYLHVMVGGKDNSFAGFAIGSTLAIAVLAGGPLSGASLNPARTFGTAIFTDALSNPNTYIIYFLGPLFGATLAVLVYQFFGKGDEEIVDVEDVEDVEVVEIVEEKPTPAKKPAARKTTTRKTTARKTPAGKTTKK